MPTLPPPKLPAPLAVATGRDTIQITERCAIACVQETRPNTRLEAEGKRLGFPSQRGKEQGYVQQSSISLTLRPDGGGVAQIFDLPLKSAHSIEVGVIFQASNTGAESLEMISGRYGVTVQLEALGRPILDVRPLSDSDIRVLALWRSSQNCAERI